MKQFGEEGLFPDSTDDMVSELAFKEAVKMCQRKGWYIISGGHLQKPQVTPDSCYAKCQREGPGESSLIIRQKNLGLKN